MLIVKEDNEQDAEIFLRTAEMNESGTVIFPVKQGVKGVGAVSGTAFATLRDDPLFLTREGVFSIASATVTQERAAQPRSSTINARLVKESGIVDLI